MVRSNLDGRCVSFRQLMGDTCVGAGTRVRLADILAVAEVIDSFRFADLAKQDARFKRRNVACRAWNLFRVDLSFVGESLSFRANAEVARRRFPRKWSVVLGRIGLALGVVGDVLEVGHVFVLGNGIVWIPLGQATTRDSVAFDAESGGTLAQAN